VAVLAGGRPEGTVTGITAGKLLLVSPQFGDAPIEIPVGEVLGLALGVATPPRRGVHLALATDGVHPSLPLAPRTPFALDLARAVTIAVPAGAKLRVEGGRRHYLSAMTPRVVEEKGAFNVTWHYAVDGNIDGSPLTVDGVRYEHGLVIHSQARLTWNLGGSYERLHAVIGISDTVGREGDCAAALVVDGKTVWESPRIRGPDAATPVDLPLAGAQTLEILVSYGERYDIGDHLALADAYLVKVK
jgi:hypothetical protein